MKMRSLIVLTLVLTVALSGLAVAKTAPQKPLLPQEPNSRATETEPNDDFSTANPLTLGEDMNAAIDPAGDVDYFSITVDAGDVLNFETLPGDVGDTQMNLYDTDGVTVLEFDDDDGQGLYSLIEGYEFPAAGTYYVAINEFGNNGTGTYILSTSEFTPPEPQENDTCDGALNIADVGLTDSFDLCDYVDDYDPEAGGCTGFQAIGPEAVYMVELDAGQEFFVRAAPQSGSVDLSLYIVTDCADVVGSCVAGADETVGIAEELTYVADAAGTYYVMIDTYSNCGDGWVDVTFDGVVSAESNSLTEIKGLFR
jgi:hypothetical protein